MIEGKTPEISIEHVRRLLRSVNTSNVVGLRDRAAIATLIYTAARLGAVAKLKRGNFRNAGVQWTLRFSEKGGNSLEIAVRHDLQSRLHEYIDPAAPWVAPKHSPLFRAIIRREKRLTDDGLSLHAMCRIVKRRMKDAGLSDELSAHSFRVTTVCSSPALIAATRASC